MRTRFHLLALFTVAAITGCGGEDAAKGNASAPPTGTSAPVPPGGVAPPLSPPTAPPTAPAPTPGPAPAPAPGPAPSPGPAPAPTPVPTPPPATPLPPVSTGLRWSDPATWGGTLPPAGATVVIPTGRTIVLDTATPALRGLTIEGTLTASPDTDVAITSDYVYVKGGRLQIGTAQQPYLRRATITLTGNTTADNPATPGFGNKVLALADGVIELHGAPLSRAWTRLNADVTAGTRQIVLADAGGWKAGDQIVIATSTPDMNQYSTGQIQSISGNTITLAQPLANAHWGTARTFNGPDGQVSVDVRAEVGNLTRNIVIQGDASSATNRIGGHAMFMANPGRQSTVQIANVEFRSMGQFNQLGRYPVHFHLMDNRCNGCYVRGAAVHNTLQRGMVVHDSAVTLDGNVVFNTVGHNYIVETASTQGAVLNGNLGMVARETVPQITEPTLRAQNDFAPANFWIKSARNTITNNHAAGAFSGGFIYDHVDNGPINFSGNLAHGSMNLGGDAFPTGGGLTILWTRDPMPGEVIDGFVAYHNVNGFWPEVVESSSTRPGIEAIPDTIPPLVSRNLMLYDNQIHVFARGPGNKVRNENTTIIGGSTDTMAFRNQYGGSQEVINPRLINFNRTVLSAHDSHPQVNNFTISGLRSTNSNFRRLPHDMAYTVATDDSFVSRGAYVTQLQPFVATPQCVRHDFPAPPALNDPPDVFFKCPRMLGMAELDVRNLSAPTTPMHTTVDILRSDGLRYRSLGYTDNGGPGYKWYGGRAGYSTVYDGGVHYSVTTPASAVGYAVRLSVADSDTVDTQVLEERATVEVRVPMTAAPRGVYRASAQSTAYAAAPTYAATDALRAAASLDELRANPLTTYFYDAAARQVVVHASVRFTSVLQ